jgi:hypothetical protein
MWVVSRVGCGRVRGSRPSSRDAHRNTQNIKFALTGAAGPAMVNCRVEGTPITTMASNRGHRLRLEDISHRFSDFVAVRDINLDIAPRSFCPRPPTTGSKTAGSEGPVHRHCP